MPLSRDGVVKVGFDLDRELNEHLTQLARLRGAKKSYYIAASVHYFIHSPAADKNRILEEYAQTRERHAKGHALSAEKPRRPKGSKNA